MVYVRRTRRTFRKRATGYPRPALKYRRKRYVRRLSTRTYPFKRTMATIPFIGAGLPRFISQASSATNLSAEFSLNQLPGYSEFTNLYDQYKITKIVVKLIPMMNVNNVQPYDGTSAGLSLLNPGLIGSVLDFDDATNLANLTDYLQYQNWRSQPAISSRTHVRVFKPTVKGLDLNAGGSSVASSVGRSGWLDCAASAVPHYGVKVYMDPYYHVNAPQTWQLMTTMYVRFKNVR